jgi:hypothetical protein
MFSEILNGGFGKKIMRNRGRTRSLFARHLSCQLSVILKRFIDGLWVPQSTMVSTSYAVSLTSWKPRLPDLPLVLLSLLRQSVRPAAIHVWLSEDDYALLDPNVILRFSTHGVRFEISDNLGPHTKWLPMIERGADNPFVICDDDILYPRKWLESLIREDRTDAYVGIRCHRIQYDANEYPASYSEWKHDIAWDGLLSHSLFVTACAGAIIHPARIADEFRDRRLIMDLCPKADDIWLKAAHAAAGIPCFKTRYSFPCLEIPGSFESSLLQTNVDDGGNDRQLSAVKHWLRKVQHDSGFSARSQDA